MRTEIILVFLLFGTAWVESALTADIKKLLIVTGALAILKGTILIGYLEGRRIPPPRGGRSVATDVVADVVFSAIGLMDSSDCVLKLICQLEMKEESERTEEENMIVDMFSRSTVSLSSRADSAAEAADAGNRTRGVSVCDRYFSECSLSEDQLRNLLKSPGDALSMI
ncbi:uncharacterized protein LOC135226879 [Macrobrachium nipponense]|uniref:uncharacterized protein LOC135226879 n=1 Tax=Macrobrachium nipponense TaxID=159736 RepID=UPI0030C8CFEF